MTHHKSTLLIAGMFSFMNAGSGSNPVSYTHLKREFMKRKLMLLLACLFVGIGLVNAQTQKVTGIVISEEDGQPVIRCV